MKNLFDRVALDWRVTEDGHRSGGMVASGMDQHEFISALMEQAGVEAEFQLSVVLDPPEVRHLRSGFHSRPNSPCVSAADGQRSPVQGFWAFGRRR